MGKQLKIHHSRNRPKRKIVNWDIFDTQIHYHSLSLLGIGISIKSGDTSNTHIYDIYDSSFSWLGTGT